MMTYDEKFMTYQQRAARARRLTTLCTDRNAVRILRRLADEYDAMALRERLKLEGIVSPPASRANVVPGLSQLQ